MTKSTHIENFSKIASVRTRCLCRYCKRNAPAQQELSLRIIKNKFSDFSWVFRVVLRFYYCHSFWQWLQIILDLNFQSRKLSAAGKTRQSSTISIAASSASGLSEAWLFSTRNCLCVMFSTECKLPTHGYKRTRALHQLTTFIHAFVRKKL